MPIATILSDVGNHQICYFAYSDNPDSTGIWCSDTICININIDSCCSVTANLEIEDDTLCIGDSLVMTVGGGSWGRIIIAGEPPSDIFPMPTDPLVLGPISPGSEGAHILCFIAYSANPDSTVLFCSDTMCLPVFIDSCCSAVAYLDITPDTDTFCIGDTIFYHIGGGPFGRVIFDGDPQLIFSLPPGGHHGFLVAGAPGIGQHQLCLVVFSYDPRDSTDEFCSDTVCVNLYIDSCCSLTAYLEVNKDTFCVGDTIIFSVGGGPWGEIRVDGIRVKDPFQIPPGPDPVEGIGPGSEGSHEICLYVYSSHPDSVGLICSDSMCITIVIDSCCLVVAFLDVTPDIDTFCIGDTIFYLAGGGPFGRFIDNGVPTQVFPVPPIGDGSYHIIRIGEVGWTQVHCWVAFSADPRVTNDFCSDTICITYEAKFCHECPPPDEVNLAIEHNDPPPVADPPGVRYTFRNVGADNPTFITWTVDGVVIGQTTGRGEIQHTFTEGTHVVCMEAAFVFPHDGHSECCYYDVCEVLHIRGCELWKAIDRITPTIPNINFPRTVFFDYEGFMGDATWNLTIIWNFGDGTTAVSSGSNPDYTYTYATAGDYNWCATMVWSIGPWDGSNPGTCCCVDSICDTITAGPCGPVQFNYEMTYYPNQPLYEFTITPSIPAGYSVRWTDGAEPPNIISIAPYLTYFDPLDIPPYICALLIYNNSAQVCTTAAKCHYVSGDGISGIGDVGSSSRLMGYYPNPTSGDLIVEFMAEPGEKAAIEITDYLGQLLLIKDYDNLNDGNNRLDLDIGDLASGLYQMKIIVGTESKVVKVVKY